jgi:hypothetical protein
MKKRISQNRVNSAARCSLEFAWRGTMSGRQPVGSVEMRLPLFAEHANHLDQHVID